MQTACTISILPTKSFGSLSAPRYLTAGGSTSSAQTSQPWFQSPEEMKTINLPSHTRICRAALWNASESVTTPQKITPTQTSHSTSTLHGNGVRHNCFSRGTRASLVGWEENKELVSLGNTGERCQVTQCTQGSQNVVSIASSMPNSAGKSPSIHPCPSPHNPTAPALNSRQCYEALCQAWGTPGPNSLRTVGGNNHINTSEIPETAFSLANVPLHSPRTTSAAASANAEPLPRKERTGRDEIKE